MTFLADDKCCVIQFAAMEPSPGTRPVLPELAPEAVEVVEAGHARPGGRGTDGLPQLLSIRRAGRVPEC